MHWRIAGLLLAACMCVLAISNVWQRPTQVGQLPAREVMNRFTSEASSVGMQVADIRTEFDTSSAVQFSFAVGSHAQRGFLTVCATVERCAEVLGDANRAGTIVFFLPDSTSTAQQVALIRRMELWMLTTNS